MRTISLYPCPKVYILETHRSRKPASTLQLIENTKEIVGMLSFRDATDVDRIGIPVFTCDRVRPDNSRTSHTGKGVSKTQAQVSLTMEAIERYSSEFREEYGPGLTRGTYCRLQRDFNVLDPRELILPLSSGSAEDVEMHWVWGCDLASGKDILVPAVSVYHPFSLDTSPLMHTHTNGIASGNTMEEAIFHALTELIERDSWSIAKFNVEMSDALVVEDWPEHRFIMDIIEKFEAADIEITAKDITSDIGVPVIAAFSQDLIHHGLMAIDGFGAHLDPRVAMARALLEVVTTRALFIQKHGIEGLRETIPYFHQGDDPQDPRFHAERQKGLGELDAEYSDDVLTDIRTVMGKLEAKGLTKTIAIDLTRPDLGIPTVRVIVPGLEVYCFDRTRKGNRLYRSQGLEG